MTDEEVWAVRAWMAAYEDLHKRMLDRNLLFVSRNDIASLIQEMRHALDDLPE